MDRVRNGVVWAPAIVMQDAVIVGSEQGGRLAKAAAGLHREHGDLPGDGGPQPVEPRRHAPPDLIHPDQQTDPPRLRDRPQRRSRCTASNRSGSACASGFPGVQRR